MSDLRKAAEMALKYFEDARGLEDEEVAIKEALRQALAEEALDRMAAENQRLGLYDEDNLQTAIEKGTKAWADVPNATEWAEELRGNDTPEVTPEVNEPEGWVKIDEVRQYFNSVGCGTIYKTAGEGRVPLYTAPYTKLDTTAGVLRKEWVGLTDEDFYKKDDETVFVLGMKFAEARLKEKNT